MEIYIVSNFSHINNVACLFVDTCNCFFRIATRNGIDYLKLCFGPGLIVSPHPKMMSLRNWTWAICVSERVEESSPCPQSHPGEVHRCPYLFCLVLT